MLIFSNFHETLSKETFKTSYFHVVVDLRFPKHPTFSVTSLAHYRIWGSVNGTFSNKLKHPQRPSEPSQLIGMVDTILKLCFSCIRFLKFQLTKPCVLIMLGRPEYPRSPPPPPPPPPPLTTWGLPQSSACNGMQKTEVWKTHCNRMLYPTLRILFILGKTHLYGHPFWYARFSYIFWLVVDCPLFASLLLCPTFHKQITGWTFWGPIIYPN